MKKLKLNKEILYNLSDDELNEVKGGATMDLLCYSMYVCSDNCGGGGSHQCGTNPYCGTLNNCGTGQVYCVTDNCHFNSRVC